MHRLVVIAIVSTTATIGAQAPTGPRPVEPPFSFVESSLREAKAGQQSAIEEFYLKLRAAEAKLSVRGLTDIYVRDQGGSGQQYYSFRSLSTWADLDTRLGQVAAETLTKAYGPEEYQRLTTALQGATESITTEILRVLPGRSTWRDNSGQAWPYIEVRRTHVRPERVAQHDEFQERIRAVRANAGTTPEVRFQVALGPGFMFVTARYFKTWADRDTWQDELAKAYGQPEADRLVNQWRQTLLDTENFVLRHRPDLSRVQPRPVRRGREPHRGNGLSSMSQRYAAATRSTSSAASGAPLSPLVMIATP